MSRLSRDNSGRKNYIFKHKRTLDMVLRKGKSEYKFKNKNSKYVLFLHFEPEPVLLPEQEPEHAGADQNWTGSAKQLCIIILKYENLVYNTQE